MFRPLATSRRRPPRRGTSFILLVVVMLSLFSAVGTAYALFAMREARLALARKGEQGGGLSAPMVAPDPTDTINSFFRVLIYDTGDDDYTDGLRGHSIGRSMYGRDVAAFNANSPPTNPFGGIGLIHEDSSGYGIPGLSGDRANLVNYTVMTVGGKTLLLDPEYTGTRPLDGSGNPQLPFNPATTSQIYVNKAAGYSYPDLKDFFLAAYDPARGEVLAPSFHRPWLLGAQNLDPNNPFWADPTNKLKLLRPWPTDHPNFPRVPQNADGSYTGDVQNLPGGVGPQKNDSIWVDMGLPVVTLPGNRKVKPLVAALVLPLNGLFNASAHGNTFYGGHGSYHGFGPWEVNLNYLLGADAATLTGARGTLEQRVAVNSPPPAGTTRAFAPYGTGVLASVESAVAWNTVVTAPPVYASTPNSLAGVPGFAAAGLQTTNNAVSHPSLFSPTEWPGKAGLAGRTFPVSDTKRFYLRYADVPDTYAQSDAASFAPTSLKGTYGFTYATGQTTQNGYRLDPAHANRGLITTIGYGLDRPKLVPQFAARTSANALTMPPYTNLAAPPYTNLPVLKPTFTLPPTYPSPQANAGVSDFVSSARWTPSVMAAISAVNLNRPLSDYRTQAAVAANQVLSDPNAVTAASAAQADSDRQQLAKDIFARLVVATGAAGYVYTDANGALQVALPDPTTLPNPTLTLPGGASGGTFTQQQYDALRYLAQMAVNVVDYIDNDDISTMFVWNPTANFTSQTDVGNRVVFGVEKSRLVINEAYGEIASDPADKSVDSDGKDNKPLPDNAKAHVRFWLELLNPSTTPPVNAAATPPANSPLGTGSVSLSAYQIEIARATRITGVASQQNLAAALFDPTDPTAPNGLRFQANTAGGFDTTFNGADIVFNLSTLANAPTVGPNVTAANPAGNYNPQAVPANGIVLLGPKLDQSKIKDGEFNPDPTKAPWTNAILVGDPVNDAAHQPAASPGSNSMVYTLTMPPAATLTNAEFKRHIVLLRRLANPYLTYNQTTNPYVTVDAMDYVPAFDAVTRAAKDTEPRTARGMMAGDKFNDPMGQRFAVGKVQPYAGFASSTAQNGGGTYNAYSFPTSMVVDQRVATGTSLDNAGNAAASGPPLNTFGQHNGSSGQPGTATFTPGTPASLVTNATTKKAETLMLPFDWLPHLDRPLVNQLELLQVRDTPPYRVTQQFLQQNAAALPGVTYDYGYANWLGNGFSRALELLTVRPYTAGVAHGGRVPGKINVNAITDLRVLQGLMDPQPGNVFDGNFVTNTAWSQWMATRTPIDGSAPKLADGTTPVNRTAPPGQSVFDTQAAALTGGDRPFLPLGAPAVTAGGTYAYTAGGSIDGFANNIDLTILRRTKVGNPPLLWALPSTNTYTDINNNQLPPAKTSGPVYPASKPNGPSYFQAEPARKILNNLTTVNHQYIVYLTIGYFDADTVNTVQLAPGVTVPRLGAEAYISVPGDMRQKVVAVVDMSNMALDPNPTNPVVAAQPSGYPAGQPWQPFFTGLEATAYGNGTAQTATLTVSYSRYDNTTDPLNPVLYVAADGQEVAITAPKTVSGTTTPGTTLVVGYGIDQQVVTVTGFPAAGQISVQTVSGLPFRTAWAGTCVSNVRPGYPGPQSGFDYNSATYKPVVPYFERLR